MTFLRATKNLQAWERGYHTPTVDKALTEVRVLHGFLGRETLAVIVAQQLVQQVQRLTAHQVLVLAVDEFLPPLSRVSGGNRGEGG